ncbi:ComF family protein [Marimonas arenosa]|uniref:ComF family protein n=1 Tax=Marimonas arenosa TaxID=1795305 RepID=A0AAE4B3T8_9RHOB|nr:ComF family protein [Marimonas arenosa]MDQ2090393.1 ComF family protein [Marimonas arenosa]
MKFQTALHLLYPPRCVGCGEMVDSDFGLCGPCWRDTPFIEGLACNLCGTPLPGTSDQTEICDECRVIARPWSKGRAAFLYHDNGRKLVLALKHGDRHDIVRPAAKWLSRAANPLVDEDTLIAPIPLHWTRLLKRRFNQSALLAKALAKELSLPWCPDLLIRRARTESLDGKTLDQRFATVSQAIVPHPKRRHRIAGRAVLLVDDVMTSGATMAAAAEACLQSGARDVSALALARVAKEG